MLKCRFSPSRALPLGAEEEETPPAEAVFADHSRVVGALSSRLAWKMETPQPCVSGLFFHLSRKRMERRGGRFGGLQLLSRM